MNLDWTDEQQRLRERILEVGRVHWSADAAVALEREPKFPQQLYGALADAGIVGYGLPQPFGPGGRLLDLVLIHETLAMVAPPAASPVFVNQVCGAILALAGNDAQKQRVLGPLASGECRLAFALTEPQAGSDAGAIALRATRHGPVYRLTGTKLYATGSVDAHYILTAARTTAEGKASRGTSLFLVPRDSAGLNVEALTKIAGDSHASCRVEYREVPVSEDLLVGPENGGWPILMLTAGVERVCVAAGCVGAATAALDELKTYLQERRQFGQPIAEFQAIRHKLADLVTRVEAMRWLTYRAAFMADRAGPSAAGLVSMAKLFATENAGSTLLAVMKLYGGVAYLAGHPAPRRLRETMATFYAGGTAEIQRELIARQFLTSARSG